MIISLWGQFESWGISHASYCICILCIAVPKFILCELMTWSVVPKFILCELMTDEVSYLNLFCVNWWLLMCHIKFISLPYELNGWLARWTEAACITLWIEGLHCLCMNWSCMYSSLNWMVALCVYELKLHVFLSELKGSIVCVWTEAAWRSRRWWRSSSPWCWSSSAWRWFGWRSGRWWSVMGKGKVIKTIKRRNE